MKKILLSEELLLRSSEETAKESLERTLDFAISLEGREGDIEDPEDDEEDSRAILGEGGTTKLTTTKGREEPNSALTSYSENDDGDTSLPPEHNESKGKDSTDGVEKNREGENTGTLHPEATRSALKDEDERETDEDNTKLLTLTAW